MRRCHDSKKCWLIWDVVVKPLGPLKNGETHKPGYKKNGGLGGLKRAFFSIHMVQPFNTKQ